MEVKIALEQPEGKLKWSNQKGQSVTLTSGSNCSLLIVTKERKPYQLIFN